MAWLDDGPVSCIRRYQPRDRELLVEVIDAVCGECAWMATTRFEPTAGWQRALDEPEGLERCLLIVEEGGKVAGWCRIFPEDDQPLAQRATLGIGLLKPHRNRGIGTALARQALAWACDAGYESVNLTTHAQNAPAIHLFIRCGFVFGRPVQDGLIEMCLRLETAGPHRRR